MIDIELLTSIAEASEVYTDIPVDTYVVPFLAIGMNGVYGCIENEDIKIVEAIKGMLHLADHQLFVFAIEDSSFYDYATGFVAFDDIYQAFENCYINHLIPEADVNCIEFESAADYCNDKYMKTVLSESEFENAYIAPIIGSQKQSEIIEILENAEEAPVDEGLYRIYPDGSMMVKRSITKKIGAFGTCIPAGEGYFPCAEESGDKTFLITLFGGLFGVHKFRTGNYLAGLGYLLTCGVCGVSYVCDLISMIIGGYSYTAIEPEGNGLAKKRYFTRPVTHKLYALLATVIAAGLAYVIVRYGYLRIVTTLMGTINELLMNSDVPETLIQQIQ